MTTPLLRLSPHASRAGLACAAGAVIALLGWTFAPRAAALHLAVGLSLLAMLAAGLSARPRAGSASGGLVAALLGLATLVVVARDPLLFTQPRFWAEEATVYFRTAWLSPAWQTLLAPHQGYYSLFANLAGLLAAAVPLEQAPLATTLMAALVPLTIVAAIALSDSALLDSPLKKAAAAAASLVVGATAEIWLTTINAQHLMPLLALLLLIDRKDQAWRRRAAVTLLLVLGLSSVAVNFLAPLFFLAYWRRRDRASLQLALVIAATCGVQLFAIAYSALVLGPAAYFHPSQSRAVRGVRLTDVARAMGLHGLALPLFGLRPQVPAWLSAGWLLALLALGRASLRPLAPLLAAWLLLTVLTVLGSFGMAGGPRYAYPGAVLISWMIIHIALEARLGQAARTLAAATWLASLFVWSHAFVSGLSHFRDPSWPQWSQEVQRWRADSRHPMQAHPVWPSQTRDGLVWAVQPAAPDTSP